MSRPNNTAILNLKTDTAPPQRIQIEGEVLVLNSVFCEEVLAGATRRAAGRLDHQGLPFVHVNGFKYRPLNEGRRWLAARIQRRGEAPRRRRAAR